VEKVINQDTAAVILEPMLFDLPKDDFLKKLRAHCTKVGALLIFDEMWTGFRLALGGAQEYFDVKADMATFSKAVANGMPISILSGRKDVMQLFDKDIFFFTTFGGEALSLAATKATITELRDKKVPAYLDRLGNRLRDGVHAVTAKLGIDYVKVIGAGCRTMLTIGPAAGDNLLAKSLVQQELIKRGILWQGQHALSFSHTESDIDYTISAYEEVLGILKDAVSANTVKEKLRGLPMEPVFRTVTGNVVKKA